jgi:hypothetical protein
VWSAAYHRRIHPKPSRSVPLQDKTYQARVAALSLAQCNTVVTLLRAHGQDEQADNMESAISVVVSIVSNELGKETLANAISWASDEIGHGNDLSQLVTAPH